MDPTIPREQRPARQAFPWSTPVLVLLLYAACLFVATYPVLTTPASRLPGGAHDTLQALWVMRWYKTCLLQGRSPLHCPGIDYPVGGHLGNFSPLYFHALLYLPLSLVVSNDVLCYNLLWLSSLLFTGLATFWTLWRLLRCRAAACLGGLLVMLAGRTLLHAHGHLELILLGWVPLFLLGWVRWVDRPTWRRLGSAWGLYVLVVLGSAYFAVLVLVPAALYALCRACAGGAAGLLPWLRRRLVPGLAFATVTAPAVLLLFLPQLLSRAEGYAQSRALDVLSQPGVPPWVYVLPPRLHLLGHLLPADLDAGTDAAPPYAHAYLGVVCLALLGYAAVRRVSFPGAGYWWLALAVLAVLSFGGFWEIGGHRLTLPMGWLQRTVFVFRELRGIHRTSLLTSFPAAVLAAAAFRHLLGRVSSRAGRLLLFAAAVAVAVADLAMMPFSRGELPAVPPCYALIRQRHPDATFLEVPQCNSGDYGLGLNVACMYWQSVHGGRTSAGDSGYPNWLYDERCLEPSPFALSRLASAGYLADPEAMTVDLASNVRFADYAWLYLTAHHLDYTVLHQDYARRAGLAEAVARLKAQLAGARVHEDEATAVYDRRLLPPRRRPTLLCTDGWRFRGDYYCQDGDWHTEFTCAVARVARLAVFNPPGDAPLTLTWEARSVYRPRSVRLCAGGRELARWQVRPDGLDRYTSPPFRLPAGLQELTLESDGDEKPRRAWEGANASDPRPLSLRVARLELDAVPAASAPPDGQQ
jgi:hypothetical protein